MTENVWLDVKEAALFIGVTEGTLGKWRSASKGPAYSKSGKIRYLKEDIEQWFIDNKVEDNG